MTCVVGLLTDSGDILFGADSLVTDDSGFKLTLMDKKIFTKNNVIFGFCGDLRLGQLVKHRFNPPSPGRNKDIETFIHTKFVPELQKFFSDSGYPKLDNDRDSFELLVGMHRSIFTIGKDFSVIEAPTRYHAIGSGAEFALGAMYATKTLTSENQRITIALEASSSFSQTVGKPFHFERLQSAQKRTERSKRGRK